MRRIRYAVAMSLDGFIAGPDGNSDWIIMDPDIDFSTLFAEFDTILLGRKTYEGMRSAGRGGMPGMQVHVFSRTLVQRDCPGVTVSATPETVLPTLKAAAGKDIWLFGGGELFRSLLDLNLVDTVEVSIIPVLLGAGLPLLPGSVAQSRLQLTKHRVYPKTGTVSLEYAISL